MNDSVAPTPVTPIVRFEGDYGFLSNFSWHHSERLGARTTVEHVFQAAKALSPEDAAAILAAPTPGKAKRLGRRCALRPDWEQVKIQVMREALREKFLSRTPESRALADKLFATGDAQLVEGNTWGDRYWGVDLATGIGENMLGRLLMELREWLFQTRAHG